MTSLSIINCQNNWRMDLTITSNNSLNNTLAPYHLDDVFDVSSYAETASSFDDQRAAALRCEIEELRDLVNKQRSTIDSTKQSTISKNSEIKRLQVELRDAKKATIDALESKRFYEEENEKIKNDLNDTRKRFRNRTRTLKTKIDHNSLQIDSLTAKCTAHEQARLKAERMVQRLEESRETMINNIKVLQDTLSTLSGERDAIVDKYNNEIKVNDELRSQVESAAVREGNLRETASTIAGFQKELADACTATRERSSQLLSRQSNLLNIIKNVRMLIRIDIVLLLFQLFSNSF